MPKGRRGQALNALVFLYKVVPGRPLAEIDGVVRAKKPQRLSEVLTAVICAVLSARARQKTKNGNCLRPMRRMPLG